MKLEIALAIPVSNDEECSAELLVSIFHLFQAGIANTISSFKWMKIVPSILSCSYLSTLWIDFMGVLLMLADIFEEILIFKILKTYTPILGHIQEYDIKTDIPGTYFCVLVKLIK